MKAPSLYELMMATPRPLRKFVRNQIMSRKLGDQLEGAIHRTRPPVAIYDKTGVYELSKKLWGGYSQQACRDLDKVLRDAESSGLEAAQAARAIGCWHASHGDFESGYEYAFLARLAHQGTRNRSLQVNLELDCLMALERHEEARRRAEAALRRDPTSISLRLSLANTYTRFNSPGDPVEDRKRLEIVNEVLLDHSLSPLDAIDPNQPLSLSNIHCPNAQPLSADEVKQAKVTILMPAYAAEETLEFAVGSLLRQTWSNLEVIIIDDRSPDKTFELAQEMARRDARVSAFQVETNGGAYAARNFGLRHATGDFVTVHDADDWSHPDKLAIQVRHLLKEKREVANLTDWARCFHHLFFRGSAKLGHLRVIQNHSSLMVQRALLLELGGWDQVRIAADSELIRRLERYNRSEVQRLLKGVPLAFSLELPSSLTRQGLTHVFTVNHGVRRNYHEAGRYWMKIHGEQAGWKIPPLSEGRAFPAPRVIQPDRSDLPPFDLLFITDFALVDAQYVSTMNDIAAALEAGARVAVFHQRLYGERNVTPPDSQLMELAQRGRVYRVSPGEPLRAKNVLVGNPLVLAYELDRPPQVECEQVVLITNRSSLGVLQGPNALYTPATIEDNVRQAYGVDPTWVPVSGNVREKMQTGGYSRVFAETWQPLIDTRAEETRIVKYRGNSREKPTIGRISQDDDSLWPKSAKSIRAAYCAETSIAVKLMGGADVPQRILGVLPQNWTVYPLGELQPREFLEQLDFYVHYPNEEGIQEFERSVIEAMASGLPVVLPPRFRATFGEAALYAEPKELEKTLLRIWADQEKWEKQSHAGLAFAHEHCDWSVMKSRLESLQNWMPVME